LTHYRMMRKLAGMASYTQFLGRIVTVQYRAGDMLLSAYGSFVPTSIFIASP